jgi:hypothetical protein
VGCQAGPRTSAKRWWNARTTNEQVPAALGSRLHAARTHLPPPGIPRIRVGGERELSALISLGSLIGDLAYRLDYRWLMGDLRSKEPAEIGSTATTAGSGSIWVPVLPHPALGSPQAYKAWDGTFFELCGFAAARVRTATYPYILRFGRDDHTGRLKKGDLILVSQARNETAEVQVIKYRSRLFLARRLPDNGWERVAEKGRLVGTVEPAGHAVGIIWGSL